MALVSGVASLSYASDSNNLWSVFNLSSPIKGPASGSYTLTFPSENTIEAGTYFFIEDGSNIDSASYSNNILTGTFSVPTGETFNSVAVSVKVVSGPHVDSTLTYAFATGDDIPTSPSTSNTNPFVINGTFVSNLNLGNLNLGYLEAGLITGDVPSGSIFTLVGQNSNPDYASIKFSDSDVTIWDQSPVVQDGWFKATFKITRDIPASIFSQPNGVQLSIGPNKAIPHLALYLKRDDGTTSTSPTSPITPTAPTSPTGWDFKGSPKKVMTESANLLTDFNTQLVKSESIVNTQGQILSSQHTMTDNSTGSQWFWTDVGSADPSSPLTNVNNKIGLAPKLLANRLPNSTLIHKLYDWEFKQNTSNTNEVNPYTGNYCIQFDSDTWSYAWTRLWTPYSDGDTSDVHAYGTFWAKITSPVVDDSYLGFWAGPDKTGGQNTQLHASAQGILQNEWYLYTIDLGTFTSDSKIFGQAYKANSIITNSYSMSNGIGGVMSDFGLVFIKGSTLNLNVFNVFATPTGEALH